VTAMLLLPGVEGIRLCADGNFYCPDCREALTFI